MGRSSGKVTQPQPSASGLAGPAIPHRAASRSSAWSWSAVTRSEKGRSSATTARTIRRGACPSDGSARARARRSACSRPPRRRCGAHRSRSTSRGPQRPRPLRIRPPRHCRPPGQSRRIGSRRGSGGCPAGPGWPGRGLRRGRGSRPSGAGPCRSLRRRLRCQVRGVGRGAAAREPPPSRSPTGQDRSTDRYRPHGPRMPRIRGGRLPADRPVARRAPVGAPGALVPVRSRPRPRGPAGSQPAAG